MLSASQVENTHNLVDEKVFFFFLFIYLFYFILFYLFIYYKYYNIIITHTITIMIIIITIMIYTIRLEVLNVMEDRFPFLIMTIYNIILLSYDMLHLTSNFYFCF